MEIASGRGFSSQITRREMQGRRRTILIDGLLADTKGQGVIVACEGVDDFCPGGVEGERPWRAFPCAGDAWEVTELKPHVDALVGKSLHTLVMILSAVCGVDIDGVDAGIFH